MGDTPGAMGALARWTMARVRTVLEYPSLIALYRRLGYLEAYRVHTDRRVASDPRDAVGGRWERVGHLQYEFLVGHGLRPLHRVLDIGCGTLRAGRHVIAYLEPGHYTGIDLSPAAIERGRTLVRDEGLLDKRPRLLVNRRLDFRAFDGERFDVLLAHSVFTHLPVEHIEECLGNVGRVMHRTSRFYFTFMPAGRRRRVGLKNFRYPQSLFEDLAGTHGFALSLEEDYEHPTGQRMVSLTLPAGPAVEEAP